MFLKEKGVGVDVPKDSRDYGYTLKDKVNEFRDEFETWADKFSGRAFDDPMIDVKGKLKPCAQQRRNNDIRRRQGQSSCRKTVRID